MRRLAAFLALILALAAPMASLADVRVIVYPNENPTNNDQNSNAQLQRLTVGGFITDALGASGSINATTGAYANMTCSPGTGLFVTVTPSVASTNGRIYQQVANDPAPLPTGGYASPLPADPTKVTVPGFLTATSAPQGPLTAPGGGLKTYYLLEGALSSVDGTPQVRTFVSQAGSRNLITVNTRRVDTITWTVKAGTPAASPTPVPVDSGNVAVCDILIPNGRTQVQSGDITMRAAFAGFVQSGNVVHVSATASPSPDAGNAAITGQMAALQFISTVGTGTAAPFVVNSTTTVANLTAQYATALSPAPTPSASPPIVKTGTFPNLVYSCPTCVTGLTAGANMLVGSGATPSVAVTAAPVFTSTTTGTLVASSTVTFSALASGCLQVNGSGVVSVTSCSGGSATVFNATTPIVVATPAGQANFTCPTCVTAVTGSGNISVTAGATPVATITNSPTFTGTVTANGSLVGGGTTPTGMVAGNVAAAQSATVGCFYMGNGTTGQTSSMCNAANVVSIYPANSGAAQLTVSATAVNVPSLGASLSVCTDGSKNLTTSGCSAGSGMVLVNKTGSNVTGLARGSNIGMTLSITGSCLTLTVCTVTGNTTTISGGTSFATFGSYSCAASDSTSGSPPGAWYQVYNIAGNAFGVSVFNASAGTLTGTLTIQLVCIGT